MTSSTPRLIPSPSSTWLHENISTAFKTDEPLCRPSLRHYCWEILHDAACVTPWAYTIVPSFHLGLYKGTSPKKMKEKLTWILLLWTRNRPTFLHRIIPETRNFFDWAYAKNIQNLRLHTKVPSFFAHFGLLFPPGYYTQQITNSCEIFFSFFFINKWACMCIYVRWALENLFSPFISTLLLHTRPLGGYPWENNQKKFIYSYIQPGGPNGLSHITQVQHLLLTNNSLYVHYISNTNTRGESPPDSWDLWTLMCPLFASFFVPLFQNHRLFWPTAKETSQYPTEPPIFGFVCDTPKSIQNPTLFHPSFKSPPSHCIMGLGPLPRHKIKHLIQGGPTAETASTATATASSASSSPASSASRPPALSTGSRGSVVSSIAVRAISCAVSSLVANSAFWVL